MDRDFLFGVIAVQLGQATPQQVMAAASAYFADRSRSIPQRLLADGAVAEERFKMIEDVVATMVEANGGDARKTMDTLGGERALYASFGGTLVVDDEGDVSLAPEVKGADESFDDTSASVTPEASGRYRLGDGAEIGRGGIGRVLVAFDEHLGREIAVKELLADVSSSAVSTPKTDRISRTGAIAARFLREARVTGQLEHPNIVPVYEVGRRADGAYYYTMKLVRGRTLADALKACRALPDRLKLLHHYVDLCNAVAYAHARGVIHRDIKTDNVMLGEFGETVVLDWGLAKVRGKRDIRGGEIARELGMLHDAGTGQTVDGSAIGTPAYMSPEQADGNIEEIDERSDIWSLGAVLYEVLTGKPPFEGFTPYEIIGKVLTDDIVAPRAVSEEIPAELSAVALKALTRDKPQRYQQAGDLADEINAYMSGGRIGAYEYGSFELLRRFVAKNRAASVSALLILLLVIAGAAVVLGAYRRAESARANEEQARILADEREHQARSSERLASYNLSVALREKATQLIREGRIPSARIMAAASLLYNPASPRGPSRDPGFAERVPGSRDTVTEAASLLFQTQRGLRVELRAVIRRETPQIGAGFNRDGTRLVVAARDEGVLIWDIEGGEPLETLPHDGVKIEDFDVSGEGDRITIGRNDGKIRVWSEQDRAWSEPYQVHREAIMSVEISQDGKLVATTGADKTLHLTDPATGEQRAELGGLESWAINPAFFPDSSRVAATVGKEILQWDIDGSHEPVRYEPHDMLLIDLDVSADGELIAASTENRLIKIWDVSSRESLAELGGHTEAVSGVRFSPDGRWLASVGFDGELRLWDVRARSPICALPGHGGPATSVAFSPDGDLVASTSLDRSVRLWQIEEPARGTVLTGHRGRINDIAWSADGKLLATAGNDHHTGLWDASSGELVFLREGEGLVGGVAFTRDGEQLAAARFTGLVRFWKIGGDGEPRELRASDYPLIDIAFSPDGKILATYDATSLTHLVDVESGREIAKIPGVQGPVFTPDGKHIAVGDSKGAVHLLDPTSGERIATFEGSAPSRIHSMSLSTDGRYLASSGYQGELVVWDVLERRRAFELVGHSRWINRAVFSPDGRLIASASDDWTVRVWSVEDREELLILSTEGEAAGIAFSPDGKSLALGDGGVLRVYPLDFSIRDRDPAELLAQAEQEAGMKLEGFSLVPLED